MNSISDLQALARIYTKRLPQGWIADYDHEMQKFNIFSPPERKTSHERVRWEFEQPTEGNLGSGAYFDKLARIEESIWLLALHIPSMYAAIKASGAMREFMYIVPFPLGFDAGFCFRLRAWPDYMLDVSFNALGERGFSATRGCSPQWHVAVVDMKGNEQKDNPCAVFSFDTRDQPKVVLQFLMPTIKNVLDKWTRSPELPPDYDVSSFDWPVMDPSI